MNNRLISNDVPSKAPPLDSVNYARMSVKRTYSGCIRRAAKVTLCKLEAERRATHAAPKRRDLQCATDIITFFALIERLSQRRLGAILLTFRIRSVI